MDSHSDNFNLKHLLESSLCFPSFLPTPSVHSNHLDIDAAVQALNNLKLEKSLQLMLFGSGNGSDSCEAFRRLKAVCFIFRRLSVDLKC